MVVATIDDRVTLKNTRADRVALNDAISVREALGEDVIGQVVDFNRTIQRKCGWASLPILVSDAWCDVPLLPIPK